MYVCQCNNTNNINNTNNGLTWAGYHNPARATSPIGSLKEKTANRLPHFSVSRFGTMVMNAQRGSNIALLSDEKSETFQE